MLFIAGLPKSGTTWLERMVGDFPGFAEYLIPDVTSHELSVGHSHDYQLPDNMFSRFDGMLVLTKMHVPGSLHNVGLLHDAGIPYVVLHRDLRDVAVSFVHYVGRTPWHPEHAVYRDRTVQEGLALFCRRTVSDYAAWVRSWYDNRDPERGLILRYEDLHSDTVGQLNKLAQHFGLDRDPELLRQIVEAHSFKRLSTKGSFFRKGIVGDWRNRFTPDLNAMYEEAIGDFLEEFGYEPMPERLRRFARRRGPARASISTPPTTPRPAGARA